MSARMTARAAIVEPSTITKDGNHGHWAHPHTPHQGRKEGKPQAIFQRDHPGKPGKRITTTKMFNSKREANDWLAEQRVTYNRDPGARPDRAKTKFPDLVEQWKRIKWAALEPRSRARYEQIVRQHLMPEFGEAKVGDITREWVRDYLAGLTTNGQVATITDRDGNRKPNPRAGQPYAAGTIHKVRTTLSSIMSEAVERKMVTSNPCHSIKRNDFRDVVQDEPRKMEFLTPDQIDALADAIDLDRKGQRRPGREGNRYRVLVLTAAYTGLRASELHALRVRDIDLENGLLTVSRSLKEWKNSALGEPGVAIFGTTKTKKPRSVELDDQLVADLAAYLAPDPGGTPPLPDSLVFVNAGGGPIHEVTWLRNWYKPAVKRALPELTGQLRFHDLRHTYVSLLIAAGIHPKEIAAQAGHASVAMTMDRYGHLSPAASPKIKSGLAAARRSVAFSGSNVVELHPSAA
jgi:integrase